MKVSFPYGKCHVEYDIPDTRFAGILSSGIHHYKPRYMQKELVDQAFKNPVGFSKLSELAVGKRNVAIIASDHTRPVLSKIIIPRMLVQICRRNPNANIIILIVTGCHRGTTTRELEDKFGREMVTDEKSWYLIASMPEILSTLAHYPLAETLLSISWPWKQTFLFSKDLSSPSICVCADVRKCDLYFRCT